MKKSEKLNVYRSKRHFEKTPEPRGTARRSETKKSETVNPENIFVIQKHAARRLHYDFRLEIESVLVSWAVPKGLPLKPADKRLAIQTEDHPMKYANFEGVIPKGEYGGGTVMVWDRGTYVNISTKGGGLYPIDKALKKGHISVWLRGEKLSGGFSLTRIGPEEKHWMIVKMTDKAADLNQITEAEDDTSALSGRTMDQLSVSGKVWRSNR